MFLADANLLRAPRSFLWPRCETTILRVADSYNVLDRRRCMPEMTVLPAGSFTRLSTQSSNMGGLRFQRRMKAGKNRVVVSFGLLYGDCISRRLHAERVEDLCLYLSSAPCLELEKLSNCLVTEVKQNYCWLRTLLKSCCCLYGSEVISVRAIDFRKRSLEA